MYTFVRIVILHGKLTIENNAEDTERKRNQKTKDVKLK
jgi:hypothetical protein